MTAIELRHIVPHVCRVHTGQLRVLKVFHAEILEQRLSAQAPIIAIDCIIFEVEDEGVRLDAEHLTYIMVEVAVSPTHRKLLVSDGGESDPVFGVLPAIFAVPRHEHQE